jgi:hypothetical protein
VACSRIRWRSSGGAAACARVRRKRIGGLHGAAEEERRGQRPALASVEGAARTAAYSRVRRKWISPGGELLSDASEEGSTALAFINRKPGRVVSF